MKAETLEQVYVEKLNDLYDAEKQIIGALPKMARSTSISELQEAFQKHLEQTKGQVKRLDEVFRELGERAGQKTCAGMQGLLKEGEEVLSQIEQGPALDAALIAAAQSVEHYEMAGYGSAQTWARQLGHERQAELLEETLEEEKQTDADLTDIAEELANPEAGNTSDEDEDEEEEDEELEDEDVEKEEVSDRRARSKQDKQ